jgi:hypothetical protein
MGYCFLLEQAVVLLFGIVVNLFCYYFRFSKTKIIISLVLHIITQQSVQTPVFCCCNISLKLKNQNKS